MRLGLQIPNFTCPSGPAALAETLRRDRARRRRSRLREPVGDGPLLPDPAGRPGRARHARGLQRALVPRGASRGACALGTLVTGVTYRHPGMLVKTVDDARRALGRPRHARDRRRVVRARAPRARRAVPAARRALRAAGGDAADREADVVGRQVGAVHGQALPARRDALRAAAALAPAPADPDRRHGREEDAAAGGALRRRLQPVRATSGAGGAAPEARRAAPPLRRAEGATTTRSSARRSAPSTSRPASRRPPT